MQTIGFGDKMIVTLFRTAILYITVTFGVRLMGKRQIGDMEPNELVVTLLISEIAAIPLQDATQPVINGIFAIFTLVILEIIVSVISMKSAFLRKLISGRSIVIIKDGVLDQKALKQVRLTVLDLIELLHGQEVFDLSTVAFAVLEAGGKLSVLLKSDAQPVTAVDMKIKAPAAGLPLPVISDTKILPESLKSLGVSDFELRKILNDNHISAGEVFLMTLDGLGNAHIVQKESRR